MDQCIEALVKFDPNKIERSISMETKGLSNNIDDDDDADVLIESEEIQHVEPTEKSQISLNCEQEHQTNEKRSPWPTYKHNTGFAATNTPILSHQRTYKQPRLVSNTIDKHPDMPEIIKHIEQNHKILICMRGAPGCGKTSLARLLIDLTMKGDYDNHIFSTDDFFYDKRSKQYTFDRNKLSNAHEQNQFRVTQRAMNGWR